MYIYVTMSFAISLYLFVFEQVGHFALSVKYNDRVHHFPIELTEDNKYYIGKHHFKTIQSIISYYKKNALFYDDNEQGVTLGSPLVIVKH